MIRKGDIVGYFKSSHFRGVVLEEILRIISKKDITLIILPSKPGEYLGSISRKAKIDKLAWMTSIDLTADETIEQIICRDVRNLDESLPVEFLTKKSKIIKPLYLFLDEEIRLYAKLRNLQFKKIKEKKNKVEIFIERFEKKHPEVKRAIVNSLLKLYGLG
jgi:tRNA(Ile)-lysidine synthase TilS/MesJ